MSSRDWGFRSKQGFFGVLDIGSSKIVCVIAETAGGAAVAPAIKILGLGHQRSRGIKAGVVTDLDEAVEAVRAAVAQAERMAGLRLDEVLVSVTCGRLNSRIYAAAGDVENGVVSDDDIARVMAGGRAFCERDGRSIIHLNRLGFRLDGVPGARDPRGMAAGRIAADLHAVTADDGPMRNLALVIERCYLTVSGFVAAPYASGLAATTEEERRLGVTCIDFGGGTASFAMFAEGQFLSAGVAPVGGQLITFDIARGLQAPLAEAERIKTLYGTLSTAQSDAHELVSYPGTGEDAGETLQASRAELAEIIQPRVAGILDQLRERIGQSGAEAYAGSRVVLTGGTSGLSGMADFAATRLGRPVRAARGSTIAGLPVSFEVPAFAAAAGLALVQASGDAQMESENGAMAPRYLGRVGHWLKSQF